MDRTDRTDAGAAEGTDRSGEHAGAAEGTDRTGEPAMEEQPEEGEDAGAAEGDPEWHYVVIVREFDWRRMVFKMRLIWEARRLFNTAGNFLKHHSGWKQIK